MPGHSPHDRSHRPARTPLRPRGAGRDGDRTEETGLEVLGRLAGNRAVADLITGQTTAPAGVGPVDLPAARPAGPLPAARGNPIPGTPVVQRKHILPEDLGPAATALGIELPKLTIEGKLTSKDDAFWDRYIRRGNVPASLADMVRSLLVPFLQEGEKQGRIAITLFSEGSAEDQDAEGKGVRFVIKSSTSPSGNDPRPFSFTHVFRREGHRLTTYLESVVAPGRGRALFRSSLLPLYDALGVAKVALNASAIGGTQEGVFAWARYGFVPKQGDWDTMRRWGLKELSARSDILGPASEALQQILLDGSPKAMRRMVEQAWRHRGPVEKFVNSVLTSNFNWNGEIDLTEPDSREWIGKYSRGEDWQSFAHLLPTPSAALGPPPELVAPTPVTDLDSVDEEPGMSEEDQIKLMVESIVSGDSNLDDLNNEFGNNPNLVREVTRRVAEAKGTK